MTAQGPHLPHLDVVDLPGLCSQPVALAQQVEELVKRYLDRYAATAIVLLCVSSTTSTLTTLSLKLLNEWCAGGAASEERGKLKERTLGVLTKVRVLVHAGACVCVLVHACAYVCRACACVCVRVRAHV